jgi:DNA-binding transcriptional LysR family regulator
MQGMLDWNDLRFFLEIHRGGSLVKAARKLQVDQSTVSRRLAALERSLDARLFDRTPKGYVLTPAGRGMLETVGAMDEAALSLERQLVGADTRLEGRVRVTTSEALAAEVLLPVCGSFHARHPGIELEVITHNQPLSLAQREADLAIRLMKPEGESLVARKVGEIVIGLYGSEAYLARHGVPDARRGYAGHAFVGYLGESSASLEARWLGRNVPDARLALRCHSVLVARAAAVAGFGLALLPCSLGDERPELRRLAIPEDLPARPIWLLVHPDLRATPRVRAVMDYFAEQLELLRPRLVGESPKAAKDAPARHAAKSGRSQGRGPDGKAGV